MAKASAIVSVCMTHAEKAALTAQAEAEGISLSTLIWQRAFNTTAVRTRGRRAIDDPTRDDEIPGLQMTG